MEEQELLQHGNCNVQPVLVCNIMLKHYIFKQFNSLFYLTGEILCLIEKSQIEIFD